MRRLKHLKLDSKIHFEEEFRNEAQKVVSHRVFKENFTRSVKDKIKEINPDNNKPFYWRAAK
jgi:hypothetical protein